ncbi:cofilin [Entomophthora muscae]|uniref:Cofilin n=3 Tax=Entomophthora muscae TaxID=34485 RepID=A0ACC2RN54_9FUNG|nr:cofilin [Entomophthora muscae]KAJ9052039.1 cofilin [Entomophthora muscae]KAJ9067486.1 cofilin [Entomophthora muscae]
MSSGVGVNQECLDLFQDLKLKHSYKYIIYKISADNTEIVVENSSTDADYETFVSALPEADCRYAVYDFEYTTEEGGKRNKICFFTWAPDNAKIKSKMLYASSQIALKKSLNGIAVEIQGTDFSEVDYESVLSKVSRGKY